MATVRRSLLRFRRRFRKRQHQVEDFGQQTEEQFERNFFARLNRLALVWRFVAAWLLLAGLLLGCLIAQYQALGRQYQRLGPVPGGLYTEGILGSFTTANPLYATNDVDTAVSRLMFAGLLRYDADNQLVGDLAESWKVDSKGTTYTFTLRPNLTWQDGKPLTAADVVFTYQTIQNPDAQSPFNASWRNISVSSSDPRTVVFKLANPLASFPYNLVNGIVPEHILAKVPVGDLRTSNFNTAMPVGAGPFAWDAIEVSGTTPATAEVRVALKPFQGYWSGVPKLRSFVVRAYATEKMMISAYKHRDLTGMAGLTTVPEEIKHSSDTHIHNLRLNAETMVFFKSSTPVLADAAVRRALIEGIDQQGVLHQLDYPTRLVKSPFLPGQIGYDPAVLQVPFNRDQAKADLTAAGWVPGKNGVLEKAGQRFIFDMYADDNPEYRKVAKYLSDEWRKLGVIARVNILPPDELTEVLAGHTYDAVLHGITIGGDPDVFVYWDSSQTDIRSANRLNFSEYKSSSSDEALQAGRSTIDPKLRAIKYHAFLTNWKTDAPAMGLYQPRFLYITRGDVYGLNDHSINTGIGRFSNVSDWMIRTAGITE
jgi:peptide/nickel transport system substrate-binding protein